MSESRERKGQMNTLPNPSISNLVSGAFSLNDDEKAKVTTEQTTSKKEKKRTAEEVDVVHCSQPVLLSKVRKAKARSNATCLTQKRKTTDAF